MLRYLVIGESSFLQLVLRFLPSRPGWAVRVMSPQDISAGMLRRHPTNLNAQSAQATVSLIADVLNKGIDVTEVSYRWCCASSRHRFVENSATPVTEQGYAVL